MLITYADVHEDEVHKFSAFASDLGLRAGQWPELLDTDIGNRQPLIRSSKKVTDSGDLAYVRYVQQFGCVAVIIHND